MSAASRSRSLPMILGAMALAFVLVVSACGDGGGEQSTVDLEGRTEAIAALTPFTSCDQLLDELQAEAIERVGPYGLGDSGPIFALEGDVAVDRAIPAAEALSDESGGAFQAASGGDGSGEQVSRTNVQEVGIDEPDLVKADADRMLVITNGRLLVIDLTGETPQKVGRLDLPAGYDHELLVAGDRALVLGRTDDGDATDETTFDYSPSQGATTVTEVDLSDPTTPTTTRTLTVDSGYVSARMTEDVVRLVLSRPAPNLGFVYPSTPGPEGDETATATNKQVIEESTLEDWLPEWSLEGGGSNSTGHLDDCEQVHQPAEFSGFGLVSVLTVDLAEGLAEPSSVSVLGAADTVYASADNLYVATEQYIEPEEPVSMPDTSTEESIEPPFVAPDVVDVTTAIHRFAADPDSPLAYEASGQVEGRLLNQFALSEHDDVLRVASTRGSPWADDSSDSLVTTLAIEGDELVELGRVDDLGKGEQIFAVRFIGTKAYVVTFRQTDPLYVIDLADPATPAVDGELKILGYSAYLHPVDDAHLVGIGQDADEDGRTSGTQVSLFDVSDPADPIRTAQYTIPGTSSEVEWDHRAFLWWAPTGTAILPLDQYDQGDYRSGALAVDVDADGAEITERGRVETADSSVRRSVVIGDTVATITHDTVTFSALDGLPEVAQVRL